MAGHLQSNYVKLLGVYDKDRTLLPYIWGILIIHIGIDDIPW